MLNPCYKSKLVTLLVLLLLTGSVFADKNWKQTGNIPLVSFPLTWTI